MKSRVQAIGDCLGGASPLARLQEHAQRLVRLQRQLVLLLPHYLQDSVTVANFQKGVLVLHVPGAAVATRVKMVLPRLIEGLFAQGAAVEEIKVKIRLQRAEYRRPAPARTVSDEALDGLDALRASLPDDSALAGSLARLLAHVARKR